MTAPHKHGRAMTEGEPVSEPVSREKAPPLMGWCGTCEAEVVIDGRPISEDGADWSHMRLDVEIGMGHAHGCWGDCGKHGCPIPEPYQVQVECGPVAISASSAPATRGASDGK